MKRSKQFSVPVNATIESFSHEGRGIARINGKTTFIAGALPKEEVTFLYTRQKKDFDEGEVHAVRIPSLDRVSPRCPHYSVCGGCSLQHLDPQAQIQEKQKLLLNLLERVGHCQPEHLLPPLQATSWHYRNKARLSVRYVEKKQATLVGFREKNNPRYITEITECAILNERVSTELLSLRQLIDAFDNPSCIAQVEVAAGDEDVALIFRHLSPLSDQDEKKLRHYSDETKFLIYLQPSGPDSVVLFHPVETSPYLKYALPQHDLVFQFHPTDFTQVNLPLNQLMVQQAIELMALQPEDQVLDLFCGLGNFSLPIAQRSACVIGVEGSAAMVERATMNAKANGCHNVRFLAANLENETILDTFKDQAISKILLDPPRTGAFNLVKQMATLRPERIVYVSCNPVTLARDADVLVNEQGYVLRSAGVMDMFPHTAHVESIALFRRGGE